MKAKRYKGVFATRTGRMVRVELWQDTDRPWTRIGHLEFPFDEPLVITWGESAKEDVIEGSHAVLRLISPDDRTYTDLFADAGKEVRMDVYVSEQLYWSGILDAESYQEPYEQHDHYEVELTFGDFGILGRKDYVGAGAQTLATIVNECLRLTGINHSGVEWHTMITTENGTGVDTGLKISADNWVKSEGELSKASEVLESSLQPLGLKIRQRAGKIYVYDIRYLTMYAMQGGHGSQVMRGTYINWMGDTQNLSADRIYSKLIVRWSRYVRDGNMIEEDIWDDERPDASLYSYTSFGGRFTKDNDGEPDTLSYWSWPAEYTATAVDPEYISEFVGCTLWTKTSCRGLRVNVDTGARPMYMVGQNEGEDRQGVALMWQGAMVENGRITYGNHKGVPVGSLFGGVPGSVSSFDTYNNVLFATDPVYIPNIDQSEDIFIKLSMDAFLQMSYGLNMTDAEMKEANRETSGFLINGNVVFIPVNVFFKTDSGFIYVWTNTEAIAPPTSETTANRLASFAKTKGRWVLYSADGETPVYPDYDGKVFAHLAYYDTALFDGSTNQRESCAIHAKYATNRPAFYPIYTKMTTTLKNTEGQIIPMPPGNNGHMWIEVLDNAWGTAVRGSRIITVTFDNMCHAQLGVPKIEVVKGMYEFSGVDTSDEVIEMDFNPDASEELEISTAVGTPKETVPMARGVYILSTTGLQALKLNASGAVSRAEELLGNMLYDQYTTRKVKITGSAEIDLGGLVSYREVCQHNKKFLMSGETQRIREMISDITITEF